MIARLHVTASLGRVLIASNPNSTKYRETSRRYPGAGKRHRDYFTASTRPFKTTLLVKSKLDVLPVFVEKVNYIGDNISDDLASSVRRGFAVRLQCTKEQSCRRFS